MSTEPTLDHLVAVEHQRLRAIVNADESALDELHAAEYMLCNPSGMIWDRATYLGGLGDGSITYARFEPVTPIEVVRSADLAALRYRSLIDVTVPGGGGHLECWHLDVYIRGASGDWQCRWSQATDTIRD